MAAAIALLGQHGEARGGGQPEEVREGVPAGVGEEARYCFQQAQQLAPNLPPIWMRAAFFHFQMKETDAAIRCSAKVLKTVPNYDGVIFNYYDRLVPSVEEVLPHLEDNRRAGQAYFRHLLGAEATGSAAKAWEWLREHSFADDTLAAQYLDLLLKQRMTEEAVPVWASYLGRRRGDCPGFQSSVQWRFREPADRCGAGLEDHGGARRGDGAG